MEFVISRRTTAFSGASGRSLGFVSSKFERAELLDLATAGVLYPENRGIYTQSDSPKKSSRNIWSLAVVSVDQRY